MVVHLNKMKIKDLQAREILDSRGNPTVEVTLITDSSEIVSSVPSGASTGTYEAKEIRDGGDRYMGKGVLEAIYNINEKIKPLILGEDVDPFKIDKILLEADGTDNKENLGSNAILGVSMCVFRAGAIKEGVPLYRYISSKFSFEEKIPYGCFNLVNGGLHSGGNLSFQEFMIVPKEDTFSENLRYAVEFSESLKEKIISRYGKGSINIGDEGGFAVQGDSSKDIFSLFDKDVSLMIDAAASEFKSNEHYLVDGKKMSREELINFYKELVSDFKIIGIEDPLEEDDFQGWASLLESIPDIMIVGDDLTVTNTRRMKQAKEEGSCNSMIVKINQVGSITEAVSAVKKAKEYGWKTVISHRSGETNDDFIADFAVGVGADFVKFGAPKRGERVAKYNRILKIEQLSHNK